MESAMTIGEQNTRQKLNFLHDVLAPLTKQELRKLKASFAHALTTSIATAVVLSLFLYIFGDFIKDKLPDVSVSAARSALDAFIFFVLLFSAIAIVRWARPKLYAPESWFATLKNFGFETKLLASMQRQTATMIAILGLMSVAVILNNTIARFSIFHWSASLILVLAIRLYLMRFAENVRADNPDQLPASVMENSPPLIAWRTSRMKRAAWRGSRLRLLAALPILSGSVSIILGARIEVAYLSSLLGGLILSWTVPLLIEEDLKTTWIERQAAVTHDQWIGAWQAIFNRWAISVFVSTITLIAAASAVNHTRSASANFTSLWPLLGSALLCGILAAFPVLLAPAFVMQIDGRRSLTNVILITLIGLFIGTVIIAVPYVVPFIYLLHREAHRYQGGRFARGSNN